MSSVTMRPRSSCLRVASSRSEANCAKAASSRYCASARRTPPPVSRRFMILVCAAPPTRDTEIDRKSTRLNSSHVEISYAVFCLKKKKRCEIVRKPEVRVRLGHRSGDTPARGREHHRPGHEAAGSEDDVRLPPLDDPVAGSERGK